MVLVGTLSGFSAVLYLYQFRQLDDNDSREQFSPSPDLAEPRAVYRSRHGFVIEYPQGWSREGTLEEYSSIAEAEAKNRNSFFMYNFPISDVSGGHIKGDQQKITAYIFEFSTPKLAALKLQELVSGGFTDTTILRHEPIWIHGKRGEKIVVQDEAFGGTITFITLQTGLRIAHFILYSGDPGKTGSAETVVQTFRFITQ